MPIRLLLFSLVFWLNVTSIRAQDSARIALRSQLASHLQADTIRVNRLNDLAFLVRGDEPQQTVLLAQEALTLARKLKYQWGEAMALYVLGIGHDTYQKYQQTLPYLNQSLALFRRLNDRVGMARVLSQIGWFYTQRGDYVLALTHDLQAQRLAEKTANLELLARTTARLGTLHIILGDYQQGLSILSTAIQLFERTNDQEGICRSLNGFGDLYRLQEDFERAERYYDKSIRLAQALNRPRLAAQAESNLAAVYVAQGNYKDALNVAHKALSVLMKIPETDVVVWTQTVVARAYLKQNRLDSALAYGLHTWKLSRQVGSREASRDANEILAQVYAAQHKFAEAYAAQQKYIAYVDTLSGRNTQQQLAILQYNYGLSEKQTQIALLKKDKALQMAMAQRQRQLLLGALIGMGLVLGLLFLVYRNNRQKQKANSLLHQQKAEIQTQRDQTNQALAELKSTQNQLIQSEKMASLGELTAGIAHEIQNPLNFVNNFSEVSVELVQELKEEQKKGPDRDEELENELLTDLSNNLHKISQHGNRASSIVKGMLEHSRKSTGRKEPTDLNALADEYLRLAYHGLRAKDKTFNAVLKTDFDASLREISIIPQDIGRVFLNLFTNAFYAAQQRHIQYKESSYQPTITVSTRYVDGRAVIIVSDNGIGIPEAVQAKIFQPFFTTKPTGEGTGLGLSLAYDIVTKGHNGTLTVESKEGEGTKFVISLPA
ncbi:tetratricopeptide repeat protein [Spirosoma sp. HMF4905]|uniref:histidine kinase n=1 Tax=Spirosoma arboris TaxID=2682092 RepID=A0A7K1S751_9BACT|nr:tetratricopeptide repeat protein [Spirosoma arboris]MVM29647.1 tetratricopeptide repeat protein [Spirosoma arboris]